MRYLSAFIVIISAWALFQLTSPTYASDTIIVEKELGQQFQGSTAPCKLIDGDPDLSHEKVDIVFFGDQSYSGDITKIETDTRTAINHFKSTNISSEVQSRFRYWLYTRSQNTGCSVVQNISTNDTGFFDCPNDWIRTSLDVQRTCNADARVGLVKHAVVTAGRAGGWANNYEDTQDGPVFRAYYHPDLAVAILTNKNLKIVSHELGHSIASLGEEYLTPRNDQVGEPAPPLPIVYPNCSSKSSSNSNEVCPDSRWNSAVNRYPEPHTGCIQGCTYNNWYRAMDKTLMNWGTELPNIFDAPSLDAWDTVTDRIISGGYLPTPTATKTPTPTRILTPTRTPTPFPTPNLSGLNSECTENHLSDLGGTLVVGSTYNVKLSFRNTGSRAWNNTTGNSTVRLGLFNDKNLGFTPLSVDVGYVPAGSTFTTTVPFTPTRDGNDIFAGYSLYVSSGNNEWSYFGGYCVDRFNISPREGPGPR